MSNKREQGKIQAEKRKFTENEFPIVLECRYIYCEYFSLWKTWVGEDLLKLPKTANFQLGERKKSCGIILKKKKRNIC